MPRTPAAITQADVARCVRAVRQAGGGVVEVSGGVIRILVGAPGEAPPDPAPAPTPVDDGPDPVL